MSETEGIVIKDIDISTIETIEIGNARIEQGSVEFDGAKSQYTVSFVSPDTKIGVMYDQDLATEGIITEPGSFLIDQAATAEVLGRNVGYKPEEYMKNLPEGSVVQMANHFGWQKGAFLIENGSLVTIANERDSLSGTFDVLALKDGKWTVDSMQIIEGMVIDEDASKYKDIVVGMSGPVILRDSGVVDLRTIVDDPRIQADFRNVVDYASGTKVPEAFFQDIRKVTPSTHAMDRMVRVQPSSVVMRAAVPEDEKEREPYERLKSTIEASELPMKMDEVSTSEGKFYRLGVFGKLPEQKMPLMSYGHDKEGNLIIAAIDGRQSESAGVSITQLAQFMEEKGALNAILTAGGGDVAIVAKREGGAEILNSPANKNQEGKRVTRNTPNVMVVYPSRAKI